MFASISPELLNLLLVNGVVGVIVPALVALIVRVNAPSWFKAVANLGLTAVAGVLTPLIVTGGTFDWRAVDISILEVFAASITAHYGLLKPTGITGTDGVIAQSVSGGLGPSVAQPDPVPGA